MSRITLVAFVVAAPIALVAIEAAYQAPTLRPIGEEQLLGSRGADAGTVVNFLGDCESVNVAFVNMGQNTVGCNDCTPAGVLAGHGCICCPGAGLVDMELKQVDPYVGKGGVDPASGARVDCGARSAGPCKNLVVAVADSTTNNQALGAAAGAMQPEQAGAVGCTAVPTGRNCFSVLEYQTQSGPVLGATRPATPLTDNVASDAE